MGSAWRTTGWRGTSEPGGKRRPWKSIRLLEVSGRCMVGVALRTFGLSCNGPATAVLENDLALRLPNLHDGHMMRNLGHLN